MSKHRMIEVPDDELVERAVSGDRAAFADIYRRHFRRVWLLVARMVPQVQDHQDLIQEVFLLVYRNLAQFQGRSSLYTWIYRIALNTCLQHRKLERRRNRQVLLDGLPHRALAALVATDAFDPDRAFERRSLLSRALTALRQLPRSQRAVMLLGPIQGRSYQQIASALGLTEDVVKGRLARGRANLRSLVAARDEVTAHAA